MNTPFLRVTTIQLAKICNVSQGTVDRALNNRKGISPRTKEKVLKAAQEYGYVPNIHARSLSNGRSCLIGVVVFDLYNPYFSRLVMELEQACGEAGYSMVVLFSHKDKTREAECLSRLRALGADGIVLCPISQGGEYMRFLTSLRLPIVTVGNKIRGIPFAGIDDFAAMRDVAEHVLRLGFRELVYFSPPLAVNASENFSAQQERYQGFLSVVSKHNVPHTLITKLDDLKSYAFTGKKAAVVCSTDYHALQALQFLRGKGVGIIGFDDIDVTGLEPVALDTVGYSCECIAQAAVKAVLSEATQNLPLVGHRIISRGSL